MQCVCSRRKESLIKVRSLCYQSEETEFRVLQSVKQKHILTQILTLREHCIPMCVVLQIINPSESEIETKMKFSSFVKGSKDGK